MTVEGNALISKMIQAFNDICVGGDEAYSERGIGRLVVPKLH